MKYYTIEPFVFLFFVVYSSVELLDRLDAQVAQRASRATIHLPEYDLRGVYLLDTPSPDSLRVIEDDPTLRDARSGFHAELQHVFDEMVHASFQDLRLITEQRGVAIETWLAEHLHTSFELFWGVLESACRMPETVHPENLLEFLDFMEELALGFIHAFQNHPDCLALFQRISTYSLAKPSRQDENVFLGASIPQVHELFEHFAEGCRRLHDERAVFSALAKELNRLAEDSSDGKQKGYPAATARTGWMMFFSFLKERFPQLKVHTTSHEYLPMILNNTDFSIVHGKKEAGLITGFLTDIAEAQRRGMTSVVFLASVRRLGERIDVNKIMEAIRQKYPDTIFIIDAAQDHLVYPDAHAVFYSKRFGATGTGMMMVAKSLGDTIHAQCTLQHGLQLRDLATTVAAFRCERKRVHFASRLQALLYTPTLWNFTGKGSYIDEQCQKVACAVATDPNLSRHFTPAYYPDLVDAANPHPWRSSRTVALHLRENSSISLEEFARRLKDHHEIQIDWISPELLPDFEELRALATLPYSKEQCRLLCDRILTFQQRSRPTYITEMPALPEVFNRTASMNPSLYRRQVQHLLTSIKRQNVIRLHLSIAKSPAAIDRCLAAVRSVAGSFAEAA